ncbi:LysR family transcriptional regulator [Rhizobium sp. RU36D]|uniref:LysR family transcriptional regulator n=1 Tax=Rhizobium sp. RU36D TaxID=1907415 RepID=UPI0009D7C177|nr:LysR family transcriptional regulator [Rhizobium sp. RU36D]SMC95111.1 transcriptional regulator, LysR family [Rhizobium sp. RU36D]
MDLRQLRNLVLVARYSSFGVAAERLNVTQPALSKSIRSLEDSLGVRLLDRGPWGVRPTEYGQRLIEYGELVLSLTDEARTEIDAMRGATRGRLRIGAITTAMRDIVPTAIKRFLLAQPEVDVSLNEELSAALYSALLNGAIDIAVMTRPKEISEEIEFLNLLDIPVDIVADRDHELVKLPRVTLADLTPYRWVIPARPEPDRLALEALFANAQLPRPLAICETTSSTFQISMISGSKWLSYLTRTSVYVQGPDAQFVALKLDSKTWTRNIGLAYRRRSVLRPVVMAFVKELEALCRAQMESSRKG